MKKIVISIALVATLVCCKKEAAPVVEKEPEEELFEKEPITKECYLGVLKNDTITAELNILDKGILSGTLAYKFYEKDRNNGRVWGKMHGDTIILTYSFMSEGKMSAREVAFLKKDNKLIEGFGDITTDAAGKVTFKDPKKLSFDSKVILDKTDCK